MHISYSLLLVLTLSLAWGTGCTYTEKIRDGKTAFERKQYNKAIPLLSKDFEKAKRKTEQGQHAFFIGECLRNMGKMTEAASWYRIAYDYQYGFDALKQYAYALKEDGQYTDAIRAFKDLGIELGSPYEYRKEIEACQKAIRWQKDDRNPFSVTLAPFNSNASDYAPILYQKDELLFTSDRPIATGEETYHWTGRSFSDLFTAPRDGGVATPLPEPLNSEHNEGVATLSATGTEIFFTRCFSKEASQDAYCQIYYSQREGEGWSKPEPLDFMQEGFNFVHPALSKDGQTLYFSANLEQGWGGYDLYSVTRQGDSWTEPKLLSRSINTERDEQFPMLDGDTLYFASEGHTGMGGLDIFSSYQYRGNWTPARNLLPPINSPSDDFGYVIDRRELLPSGVLQRGYLTSARPMEVSGDNIFIFEKKELPPEPEPQEQEPVVYQMTLDVYVLEKIFAEPNNPNSEVLGRKPLTDAALLIQYGDQEERVRTDESGKYTLELEENTAYDFLAAKEGYLRNDSRFSTVGIARDPRNPVQNFELEIELDKIYIDREIVLENIYYDFDKAFIREDAQPTLNALAKTLQQNPDIRIQLSSHTDCRGSERYNQDLAQRRAQSAVDYLIEQGIDPRRLTAYGYGESAPAVDCICAKCTEDQHQANRRTTFKILE